MKKILVPTDFSEFSGHAFHLACQMAETAEAEVITLHVLDLAGFIDFSAAGNSYTMLGAGAGLGFDETMMENLMETAKEKMSEFIGKYHPYPNKPVTEHIEFGNAYQYIIGFAKENHVDLIVMGSKGSGGLEEFLVGSNTEKVVRHAKCPVLTVKRPVEFSQIKDLVFGSDFTEEYACIATELLKIQKIFNAKIHLVRVNTPNSFVSTRESTKLIKDFVAKHHIENYTINIYDAHVEEDGIVHFAQDIDTGMIAIATHGRTGIMHLLSGSIAEDVVNNARRPVWTFKLRQAKEQ